MNSDHHLIAQGAAAAVAATIANLQQDCVNELAHQDQARANAQTEIAKLLAFIRDGKHIIGNLRTKHGEIAEQIEIGFTNARCLLHHLACEARKDEHRTGYIDYWIDKTPIQSKFYNGVPNSLGGLEKHLSDHPEFVAIDKGIYHIPKDQYEIIEKVLHGESVVGVSERTARAIFRHVEQLEVDTSHTFENVVHPAQIDYREAQRGAAEGTISNFEHKLDHENEEIEKTIRADHQPGLGAFAGAAAQGAIVGGALRLGTGIWRKFREGRNVFYGELTWQDWKELGVEAAVGAGQGGIAAGAIFALTQQAGLAAPFAGAFVSTSMGIAKLVKEYRAGKITFDQFMELGLLNCFEGAVVGLAAAAGQAIIPIPFIGAITGSLAARYFVSLGKNFLSEKETALGHWIAKFNASCRARLDSACLELIVQVEQHFRTLDDLTRAAFDLGLNAQLRFEASLRLANAYGVEAGRTVQSLNELDRYMMG